MLSPLSRALEFTGRHATPAYALSVLLGLALPQLASTLRPFIPISIFIFIVLSFARANLPGLRRVWGRPGPLALALALTTVLPPLVGWGLIALLPDLDPGIRLGIALMASAPPLMASPVFAAVIGLENSLALTLLVAGMALTPFTAPGFATLLAGAEVPIAPLVLAQRLAIFIGGGMLAGLAFRRLVGFARIASWKNQLDGIGVVLFFLFAIAAMDGVIDAALRMPLTMLMMLGLACLYQAIGFAAGYLVAWRYGFGDRFSIAITTGLRNMGMLMAPIFSLVPQTTFLYFALAQIPIYFAPLMLRALLARLRPPAPEE